MIANYGVPRVVLSDRGSHFVSEMMKELWGVLGIEKLQTSSYHPQTNGLTERAHRYINDGVATLCKTDDKRDWEDHLQAVLFAYRTSDTEMMGMSPFEALFGREPRLPVDLLFGDSVAKPAKLAYDYGFALPVIWRESYEKVLKHREAYEERMRKAEVEKCKPVDYAVGSKVMLSVPPRMALPPGHKGPLITKLMDRWRGPYVIVKKLSPNVYELDQLPVAQRVVNVTRLLPYRPYQSRTERGGDVPDVPEQQALVMSHDEVKRLSKRATAQSGYQNPRERKQLVQFMKGHILKLSERMDIETPNLDGVKKLRTLRQMADELYRKANEIVDKNLYYDGLKLEQYRMLGLLKQKVLRDGLERLRCDILS